MKLDFHWDPACLDLTQLAAPKECLGCNVQSKAPICEACYQQLEPIPPGCQQCGAPNHPDTDGCDWCRRLKHRPDAICSLLTYRNTGRQLFQMAKYMGYHRLLPLLLQTNLTHFHATLPFLQYQTLTPIPESLNRKWKRPFNPAEILARSLAEKTGLSVTNLLKRKQRARQVGLDQAARRKNAAHSMTFSGHKPPAAVILVDDVLTSGATMEDATRALRAAGVTRVAWVTLFREI